MRLLQFGFLTLAISFAAPVLGQSPPQRDPQAVALLQRALARMGSTPGASGFSTRATGQYILQRDDGPTLVPATLTTKGSDRCRVDYFVEGKSAFTILNAGSEWTSRDDRAIRSPASRAMFRRVEHVPALSAAAEIDRPEISLKHQGNKNFDGAMFESIGFSRAVRIATAVDSRLEKLSETEFLIDVQTGLISRIRFQKAYQGDWRFSYPVEFRYSDYKSVSGLLIPFRSEYYEDGRLTWTLVLEQVEVNAAVDDAIFLPR